jgi:hypothetical protein
MNKRNRGLFPVVAKQSMRKEVLRVRLDPCKLNSIKNHFVMRSYN